MQIFSYCNKGNCHIFFSDYLTLPYYIVSYTIESFSCIECCRSNLLFAVLLGVKQTYNHTFLNNINLLYWHDNVYRTCFIRIIHILKPPSFCHCGIVWVSPVCFCISNNCNKSQLDQEHRRRNWEIRWQKKKKIP